LQPLLPKNRITSLTFSPWQLCYYFQLPATIISALRNLLIAWNRSLIYPPCNSSFEFLLPPSSLVPRTSYLVPRPSYLVPRHLIPHPSSLVPRTLSLVTSSLVPRPSSLVPSSFVPRHLVPRPSSHRPSSLVTSSLVPRTSYLVPRHLVPRPSYFVPRPSSYHPLNKLIVFSAPMVQKDSTISLAFFIRGGSASNSCCVKLLST
jgi:hypothetical protein